MGVKSIWRQTRSFSVVRSNSASLGWSLSTILSILFSGRVILYFTIFGFRGYTPVLRKKKRLLLNDFKLLLLFQDTKVIVGVQACINIQTQGSNILCIMLATYSCLPNLSVIFFFFLFRVVPIFSNSKQLLGSFYLQNPQTDITLPLPWLTNKLLSRNLLFFPEPALVWYFYLRRSSCKSVLMETLSCYIRSSCHADPSLGCAVCSLAVTVTPSCHPHTWVSLQGWHWELWFS